MLSSLSFSPPSSAAAVRVEKATSEFLVGPDWTINMEICDSVNSHNWLVKDVVKALKKRLQHKNPRVQLLALTLLETMVKNCGDSIHFHIAERKILDEMIKLVKKRGDMQVRDKVLMLLDSWQEAFGGPGGKHAQYYWACDELRRSGIQFPPRSVESAPIFTPPVAHPSSQPQPSLGMPTNTSRRLDEAMASEVEGLSLSSMEAMRDVMDLLSDMLRAVNPNDRMAVKDEVIVDLVERCRSNQKKLMQMLTTTVDEELLAQGLELNDVLQIVLAKHDAIASGSPLPTHGASFGSQPNESPQSSIKPSDARGSSPASLPKPSEPNASMPRAQVEEEEEADDEFAQLARRHAKRVPTPSQSVPGFSSEDLASSSNSNGTAASTSEASATAESNALVLADPPAPVKTTKELDMVDFLSIVLSTADPPQTPKSAPAESFSGNDAQVPFNNYVAPWAQPQGQAQATPQQQHLQPHLQHQGQQQQQMYFQSQPQQSGHPQFSSAYPPPPWAGTAVYSNNYNSEPANSYGYSNSTPLQGLQSLQRMNSLQNTQYVNSAMQAPQSWSSTPMQGAQSMQLVNSVQHPQPIINQPAYSAPHNSNHASAQGVRSLQHVNSFQSPGAINQSTYSTSPMNSSAPAQGGRVLQHTSSFPNNTNSSLAMNGDVRVTAKSVSTPAGQRPFIPSYRLFEDLNVLGSAEGKLKHGPYSSASESSQGMVGGRR